MNGLSQRKPIPRDRIQRRNQPRIQDGSAQCDVLSTPSRWFGVTYKEDRPAVVEKFAELAREGVYPTPLYQ